MTTSTNFIIIVLLLTTFELRLSAQKHDTINPSKGNPEKQLKNIKEKKIKLHSDSPGDNEPKKSPQIDSTVQNKYGDLLNDDPEFNPQYHWWKPALQVMGTNVFVFSVDRFVFQYDYSKQVGFNSWAYNMKKQWEWDNDRFGINFIGHPYSGSLTFNAGRSNGYNYFQSAAFSTAGSVMWEYFGENTRPSYNDIINTPVNGAFLGEILYRISSDILDDRTRGSQRVMREILAGVVDPMRGFNRLLQGKTFRTTNKEVYQKEPLNVSFYLGLHKLEDQTQKFYGTGVNSQIMNIQLDYGNPFEIRTRKPFDFFRLRSEFNFGVGRKILDNITGYGILFGKNVQLGKLAMLIGGYQYYDYWDNKTFELGTVAFAVH